MRIPEEIITEIIERTDISDYISRYVPLKHAGSVMSGNCPFHNERTPSFTVFPNTKTYYCFGCGAGGNVIGFAMAINGLDYVEALRSLAKEVGITIPEDNSERIPDGVKKSRIYEANKETGKFFHQCLISESGAKAMEYLRSRELSITTIKRFGIGYAPDSWDSLYKHLKGKGFTDKELDVAFLCKKSKNGKFYDIFRNRIVFPLISTTGEVLGFSARRLNEADERKYINTSDTPVFKKSRFVFALNMAKAHSTSELIMCEGCVDAIALQQAGFDGAVATLGTAITPEQSRQLAKFTKKIYLCYDSDSAGQTAAEKGIKLLSQLGVSSKIVKVTDAKDPDEYIKKFGKEAFKKLLTAADGEIDFLIKKAVGGVDVSVPENKLKAFSDICALLSGLDSLAEREVYASRAAQILEMSKDALLEEIAKRRRGIEKKAKKDFEKKQINAFMGVSDRANKDKLTLSSEAIWEEKLLAILIIQPDLYSSKEIKGKITKDLFFTTFGKKIFSVFEDSLEKGTEPNISSQELTPEETSALAKIIASQQAKSDSNVETVLKLISALETKKEQSATEKAFSDANVNDGANMLKEYINMLNSKKNKKDNAD